jgi:peptide/nickel transport system substrate-binding protein
LIKAKEEFQKAWNGKVWDKGFQVTLVYDTGNEVFQTVCEILKENIESLNPRFKIGIQGIQWPSFLDAFKSGTITGNCC